MRGDGQWARIPDRAHHRRCRSSTGREGPGYSQRPTTALQARARFSHQQGVVDCRERVVDGERQIATRRDHGPFRARNQRALSESKQKELSPAQCDCSFLYFWRSLCRERRLKPTTKRMTMRYCTILAWSDLERMRQPLAYLRGTVPFLRGLI